MTMTLYSGFDAGLHWSTLADGNSFLNPQKSCLHADSLLVECWHHSRNITGCECIVNECFIQTSENENVFVEEDHSTLNSVITFLPP